MPDTGAPWNIPYADPTDLVRDWPALSEDVAEAVADGLDVATLGLGKNVVQTVKTDTFTSSSTSYVTVTGLTASITPSSTSSKVLIIVQLSVSGARLNNAQSFKVTRGGTDIYRGDAAGSRTRSVFSPASAVDSSANLESYSMVFLDSPGVATSTTYQVEATAQGSSALLCVNRSETDTDQALIGRGASSITLIEVAA
jgi:hypothetical protein